VESRSSAPERGVTVRDDVVVKLQEPGASRRERLRTLAGQALGRETGLFAVPEIVSFDDARGELVFERWPLPALGEFLSDPGRSLEIAERAAVILAAIHSSLEPPQGATTATAGCLGIDPMRELVPLHGDFGITNVRHLAASDAVAVIDWSNADWIGVDADLGAPEIDVGVFMRSLFHRSVLDRTPRDHRHRVARRFLTTYAATGPHGLDLKSLRAFSAATDRGFRRLSNRVHGRLRARLGYSHGRLDLHLFLRRLARQGLER
jgi:hypothetical protein